MFFLSQMIYSQGKLPFLNKVERTDLAENSYAEIVEALDEYFEIGVVEATELEEDGDKVKYLRWKHYWRDRLDENGDFPSGKAIDEVIDLKKELADRTSKNNMGDWMSLGPFSRSGGYWGVGRTMAIDFHPTDSYTFFVGAAKGGIWKTMDGGRSYESLGDQLPYNAVTLDGGDTWAQTGLGFNLSQRVSVMDMKSHPLNSDFVLVATERGMYKSVDRENYNRVTTGLPNVQSTSKFPRQIIFHPTDALTAYVAWWSYWDSGSGLYMTEDGGETWRKIYDEVLPQNTRITIAVTEMVPDKIVAKIVSPDEVSFIVSEDRGDNWVTTNPSGDIDGNILYISPSNPEYIYTGYFYIWGSDNNAQSFERIAAWDVNFVHVDQWDIQHNPADGTLYWCNDGGIYNHVESTGEWVERSNGLGITQMYDIAVSQTDPDMMIMGSQDNGGAYLDGNFWRNTNGGDAMTNAIDRHNDDRFFTTYPLGLEIYRTMDGWNSTDRVEQFIDGPYVNEADWLSPICISPHNSTDVFAASKFLFHSTDNGDNWTNLGRVSAVDPLRQIEISPADGNMICAISGNLFFTSEDYGATWSQSSNDVGSGYTYFFLHPYDENVIWATKGGYSYNAKVFRSDDKGSTWTNISNLGTELGVYQSAADDISWQFMDNGLPLTPVTSMVIQESARKLRIGTYGRGAWEFQLSLPSSVSDVASVEKCAAVSVVKDAGLVTFDKSIISWALYNLSGQLIHQSTSAEAWSYGHIADGIYVIIVEGEEGQCTEKLYLR